MREFLVFCALCLFFVGIPAACLIVGAIAYDNWACKSKAETMGFPARYGPVIGCMIEHAPGKHVPIERYRVLD